MRKISRTVWLSLECERWPKGKELSSSKRRRKIREISVTNDFLVSEVITNPNKKCEFSIELNSEFFEKTLALQRTPQPPYEDVATGWMSAD